MKGEACFANRWGEERRNSSGKFRFEAIRIMNRAIALDVNKLNENQLFSIPKAEK